jgi:hypothetical protein
MAPGLMDEDEEGEGGSVAVADRQSSLVPALLPEERPARLTHLWPSFIRSSIHLLRSCEGARAKLTWSGGCM